jgi:hypothetical protein
MKMLSGSRNNWIKTKEKFASRKKNCKWKTGYRKNHVFDAD